MQFIVIQVQYVVGTEPVTIVTQHPLGLRNVRTTQTALEARLPTGRTEWGDAEVLAEVQAQLTADPTLAALMPTAVLFTVLTAPSTVAATA